LVNDITSNINVKSDEKQFAGGIEMTYSEYWLNRKLVDMRLDAVERKAETQGLFHQTGHQRQRWLSRQVYRLLTRLGRLLMASGQRLERYGSRLSPSPSESR
jgi:hypothetical protein